MATLTLDDDLMSAMADGDIDLNTAHRLHKARRTRARLETMLARREKEVKTLRADIDTLTADERDALEGTEAATEAAE